MQRYIVEIDTAAFYDLHFRLACEGPDETAQMAMSRAKATFGFDVPDLPDEVHGCGVAIVSEEGPELSAGTWMGTLTTKVTVGAAFEVEADNPEDAKEAARETFSWPMAAGDWVLDGTDYIHAGSPEPLQAPAPSFRP